jgi:hypothetical protein
MPVLAESSRLSSAESAVARLQKFLASRRAPRQPAAEFECFERELHGYFVAAEREVLGEELARWDLDLPWVEIDGQRYRRVLRCAAS